jgi:hypothetical protein
MSQANKKQRHEAKRKAKRLEARRREAGAPAKRLAEAKGEIEYWMSEYFETMGQAQIFIFKQAAGLSGLACFLVDRGVVGLKDCYVRMGINRSEFSGVLDKCAATGIKMRRAGIEDIRRMVAGGIRWAHDNGMRLPKDWNKPALFIGGVGDWASADVSVFVKEFSGHPEDLRQRLIGQSFDAYLKRDDIDFMFSDSAPYLNQKTGRYIGPGDSADPDDESEDAFESIADDLPLEEINMLAKRFKPTAAALAEQTAAWLSSRNEIPSPELLEAWTSMMIAAATSKLSIPDADDEQVADLGYEMLKEVSGRIEESRFAEYERAVGQVFDHMQTDADMIKNAVLKYGLEGEQTDAAAEGRT